MKKLLIIITAFATLVGCNIEGIEKEPSHVQQVPVNFSVYSGPAGTRAAVSDEDTLKNTGFLMYANVNDPASDVATPFMNAQNIEWNTSAWVYAPVKYWPTTEGATVDFYPRYTDGSENVKITYDWNCIPQLTFSVNNVVSKQTDMLWAAPILNARRVDYVEDPVKISFKHALASFSFQIKLAAEYANTTVKVKSVTLDGYFAPKATLDVLATDINKIWDLQGEWGKRAYVISAEGDEEISEEARTGSIGNSDFTEITGAKGKIMVLPFNDTEYTITLTYDVVVSGGESGDTTNTSSVSTTVTGADLLPGHEIVTKMTLTLDPITFDAELSSEGD